MAAAPQVAAAHVPAKARRHHTGGPSAHAAVVDGTAATAGSWPWMAFVANVQQSTACSGTVISPMVVLTAAHCAENLSTGAVYPPSAFRVVIGTTDWSSATASQVSNVSAVEVDPQFSTATLNNDVAVLILSAPTSAPAIRLASAGDSSLLNAGTPVSVAGWGATYSGETSPPTALYWGASVVQSSGFCTNEEYIDGVPFDPTNALCALDSPSLAIATCHGDSGGPLVAADAAGNAVEIGITSRGDPLCNPDFPSVFTQAAAVSGWAQSVVAANPPPAAPAAPTVPAPAPAPATAAAATHASTAVSRPAAGTYAAETSVHGARVSVSVGARADARVTVRLRFVLACPARQSHSITISPRPVTSKAKGWHIAISGVAAHHLRYTLTGAFRGASTIAGTFKVSKVGTRCSTGTVSWRALAGGTSASRRTRALRNFLRPTGLDIRLSLTNNDDGTDITAAEAQSTIGGRT
jgi:secreted trypsin-like serine protease